MLSLSDDLSFVLEPADLLASWDAPRLPKWGEKNFSKRFVVVGQKTLISKRGFIRGFIFRENRK